MELRSSYLPILSRAIVWSGCGWILNTYPGSKWIIPDIDTQKVRLGNILCIHSLVGGADLLEFVPKTPVAEIVKSMKGGGSQCRPQRLPNGNTLMEVNNQIQEIDENGTIVWSLPDQSYGTQAIKYSYTYPGILALCLPPVSVIDRKVLPTSSFVQTQTRSKLLLHCAQGQKPSCIRFFSLNGREVAASPSQHSSEISIDISALSEGAYYLVLQYPSGELFRKCILVQ